MYVNYVDFSYINFVDCRNLDNPSNGQVTLTGTTVGSTAVYECDSGITLVENMERTWQGDGTWSGADPTCDGMLWLTRTTTNKLSPSLVAILSPQNLYYQP